MKRALQFALLLVAAGAALPAFAQRAGRAAHNSEFRIVSAPAGTQVMTAAQAQQAGFISTGGARAIARSNDASVAMLLDGGLPVPGLGFDYTHLAARNRNLETRALIDPVTQQRLALARQIRRETPAGTVFPLFPIMPQVIVVQSPPPVIVLQQDAGETDAGGRLTMRAERVSAAPREPEAAAEPPVARAVEPHRVLEEYVLVRKDGREIFAVAFSAKEGRLIYITREGVRRSLALAELDREATTLRNDERGADVKLPI